MTHVRVRGPLGGAASPFHHAGYTDQIQVFRLAYNCLQLLEIFAMSLQSPGFLTEFTLPSPE